MGVFASAQTTPVLNFNVPASGSNTGVWGPLLNANMVQMECFLTANCLIPGLDTAVLEINGGAPLTTSAQTGSGNLVLQNAPTINNATLNGTTATGQMNVQQLTFTGTGMPQYNTTNNTDGRGVITLSGGTGSYILQGSYSNPPICVFTPNATASSFSGSAPSFTLNVTASGSTAGYICFGGVPVSNPPFTNLTLQTQNNTSACSTSTFPSYCTIAMPAFTTTSSNTNAQTQVLAPTPGHVSQLPVSNYFYSGNTIKNVAAIQPWFSTATGCNGHPCIGYTSSNPSLVAQQDTMLCNEGFSDISPDWYGNTSAQSVINNTVIAEAADLAGRVGSSCPLKMEVMIDKGLITSGMVGAAGCPTSGGTEAATITCIENVLNAAYDYVDANWGRKAYYRTDGGLPVTFTFIIKNAWTQMPSGNVTADWNTIWAAVKAHMSSYATTYKVYEEFGNFTDGSIDGAYGWPQPPVYTNGSPSTQLCWNSVTCSTDYYVSLYTQGQATPSRTTIGLMNVGFDWSNASYNGGVQKIIARQCGQIFLNGAAEIATAGYNSGNQLPYVIWSTLNDYGEGTNFENGVDNCYRMNTPTIVSNTLSWTTIVTDATYATTSTIDHWRLWYGDNSTPVNLWKAQDNIPVGTTSLNLSTIVPTGTWNIYVEMVGKPLIFNRMSAPISYTH
jgi:hypothetical protein